MLSTRLDDDIKPQIHGDIAILFCLLLNRFFMYQSWKKISWLLFLFIKEERNPHGVVANMLDWLYSNQV